MTLALLFSLAAGAANCVDIAKDHYPAAEIANYIATKQLILETEGYYINDIPGAPMACRRDLADKWRRAMRCAYDKMQCLKVLSPSKAKALDEAFSGWLFRQPAVVVCFDDILCGAEAATQGVPGIWRRFQETGMMLNQGQLGVASDDDYLCEVALHESLHWAGERGAPGHNSGNRDDDIYSCARFCAMKCQEGNPLNDCMTCADSDLVKLNCGIGHKVVDKPSSDYVCDNKGLTAPCKTARWFEAETCDGARVPPLDLWCCAECQAGRPGLRCEDYALIAKDDCTPTSPWWCKAPE